MRELLLVLTMALVALGCGSGSSLTATPALTPSTRGAPTSSPTDGPAPTPVTAPTASARPPATPSIVQTTPDASARAVIERFLSDFAEEQPPFHVESDITGRVTAAGQDATFEVSTGGDITGEDFAGEVTTVAGQRVEVVEVVIVAGDAYVRTAEGRWQKTEDFSQAQPLNPFARLSAGDLTYRGTVARPSGELHHLSTETWIGGAIEDQAIPGAVLELEASEFNIFVTLDGVPVEAQLEFSVVGTTRGQDVRLSYVVDYRFSDVGVPVTIEAPIP